MGFLLTLQRYFLTSNVQRRKLHTSKRKIRPSTTITHSLSEQWATTVKERITFHYTKKMAAEDVYLLPPKKCLDNSLINHSICHFGKPCDIRTVHIVAWSAIILSSIKAAFMDVLHDHAQPLINFFTIPAKTHRVL